MLVNEQITPPRKNNSSQISNKRLNINLLLELIIIKCVKLFKLILLSPVCAVCALIVLSSSNRQSIYEDASRVGLAGIKSVIYNLLFGEKSWRNVLYYRLNPLCSGFLKLFLKENKTCHIATSSIGGGLLIVHGDCTYIYAQSIGKNLYINQNVTIGVVGPNSPVIGDNVRVATGAIVIGGIRIGNNVTIGAGAVVVKDVPDDCVVVGNPARIVKMKGEKVSIPL